MSVGRNDPCPCGSEKKYKKCCMAKDQKKGKALAGRASTGSVTNMVAALGGSRGMELLKGGVKQIPSGESAVPFYERKNMLLTYEEKDYRVNKSEIDPLVIEEPRHIACPPVENRKDPTEGMPRGDERFPDDADCLVGYGEVDYRAPEQ